MKDYYTLSIHGHALDFRSESLESALTMARIELLRCTGVTIWKNAGGDGKASFIGTLREGGSR